MRRSLLLLATVALLTAGAGCLREFEKPHHVSVANLDLAAERVLATEVVLNLTSYLDNRGGGSTGDITLLAKAYDQRTGFLITQAERHVGVIPGDTTRAVSQHLQVPREGAVRLEVALFEDGQGSQRASITASNLEVLKPEVFRTGLKIGEMDFTVLTADNRTRPVVEAALYFTNEAETASEDLRVQVKAREVSTRLVADTQWLTTSAIAPGTTVIRSVALSVPGGYNYLIEILTWRGDVIVDRAEGRVQLAPTFEVPKDQEVIVTNPNIGDFARPTPTTATPGYPGYAPDAPAGVSAPALALMLAAVAAVALGVRRWRA